MLTQTPSTPLSAAFPQGEPQVENRRAKGRVAPFYIRMAGDAMSDAGINDNDILVARPVTKPQNGAIVVAVHEGKLVVRRYFSTKKRICLAPDNVNYPAAEISKNEPVDIVGVVIQVIHPS